MTPPRSLDRPLDGAALVEGTHYSVLSDGCWRWLPCVDSKGYGHTVGGKIAGETRAHRASYALVHGPIPKGDHIHHACGFKTCINPDHLEHHTASSHLHLHRASESVLTWDDVRAIRAASIEGTATQYDLMTVYGIAQPTLSDIITNTTWVDPGYEPGRLASCAECGGDFLANRANQRFCTKAHRLRWNARVGWRRRHGWDETRAAA